MSRLWSLNRYLTAALAAAPLLGAAGHAGAADQKQQAYRSLPAQAFAPAPVIWLPNPLSTYKGSANSTPSVARYSPSAGGTQPANAFSGFGAAARTNSYQAPAPVAVQAVPGTHTSAVMVPGTILPNAVTTRFAPPSTMQGGLKVYSVPTGSVFNGGGSVAQTTPQMIQAPVVGSVAAPSAGRPNFTLISPQPGNTGNGVASTFSASTFSPAGNGTLPVYQSGQTMAGSTPQMVAPSYVYRPPSAPAAVSTQRAVQPAAVTWGGQLVSGPPGSSTGAVGGRAAAPSALAPAPTYTAARPYFAPSASSDNAHPQTAVLSGYKAPGTALPVFHGISNSSSFQNAGSTISGVTRPYPAQAQSTPSNALTGVPRPTIEGILAQTGKVAASVANSYVSAVAAGIHDGVDQATAGYRQALDAKGNPLQLLDGSINLDLGVIGAIGSPIYVPAQTAAEVIARYGNAGISYTGDKISNLQFVQQFSNTAAGNISLQTSQIISNIITNPASFVGGQISNLPYVQRFANTPAGYTASQWAQTTLDGARLASAVAGIEAQLYQAPTDLGSTESYLSGSDKHVGSIEHVNPPSLTPVWNLPPIARGNVLHRDIGSNLSHGFPRIDRAGLYGYEIGPLGRIEFADGHVFSIKSLNVNDVSYQKASNFRSKIKDYIDDVSKFAKDHPVTYKGIVISPTDVRLRHLNLLIPSRSINDERRIILKELEDYARTSGVSLNVLKIENSLVGSE